MTAKLPNLTIAGSEAPPLGNPMKTDFTGRLWEETPDAIYARSIEPRESPHEFEARSGEPREA